MDIKDIAKEIAWTTGVYRTQPGRRTDKRLRPWPIRIDPSKLSPKLSVKIVEAVLQAMVKALRDGEEVAIRGFGTFYVYRPIKTRYDEYEGHFVETRGKKRVVFHPAKALCLDAGFPFSKSRIDCFNRYAHKRTRKTETS